MTSDLINKVRELLEFDIFFVSDGGEIKLFAEIHADKLEFDNEKPIFDVNVREALLELDVQGAKINAKSRYGDVIKQNEVITKSSTTQEVSTKVSGKAALQVDVSTLKHPGAALSAEASAGGQTETTARRETSGETRQLLVKAIGSDRWRISEPTGEPLSGKYLGAEEHLCILDKQQAANRTAVTGRVTVRQRDLMFTSKSKRLPSLTMTHAKMLNIFVSKELSGDQELYEGKIVISKKEIEYEG